MFLFVINDLPIAIENPLTRCLLSNSHICNCLTDLYYRFVQLVIINKSLSQILVVEYFYKHRYVVLPGTDISSSFLSI